jgi:NAD(P)-dependent dehydrogenase (short-subunit alcohol dehydrogenase family)
MGGSEMKNAIVTGPQGQLGPIWTATLESLGYEVYGIGLPEYDLSDPDCIRRMRGSSKPPPWKIDAIILNAAIDNPPGSKASFHGNLEEIIKVNLIANCRIVSAFLPLLIKDGGGVIVGISSIQGRVGADWRNYEEGFEKPVGYNLSKAALEQYARSLTVQYGRYGIRACCIGFGAYDGGKLNPVFLRKYLRNVPMGRPVSRQSLEAALRFALECPDFAGQTVMVDGGYCVL